MLAGVWAHFVFNCSSCLWDHVEFIKSDLALRDLVYYHIYIYTSIY